MDSSELGEGEHSLSLDELEAEDALKGEDFGACEVFDSFPLAREKSAWSFRKNEVTSR